MNSGGCNNMTERQISPNSGSKKQLDQAETTYESLLNRIKEGLERVEEQTWEGIKYDLEQAVELEAAAEELTKEEIALLAAYLKKDLKSLTHYMEETGKGVADWLKFDTKLVENRLLDLLLSVADKTNIQQRELERRLKSGPEEYVTGERVIPGTFACINCGDITVFSRPRTLKSCRECKGDTFRRITSSDLGDD